MSQNDDNDVPQGATPVAGSDASAGASEDSSPAASGGADEAFPPEPFERHADSDTIVDNIVGVLRTIYDPEIPVNIVDLGLIYGCDVTEDEEGEGKRVDVTMTLTAPGCGMGQVLKGDVEQKIGKLAGVSQFYVDLVFDPPWSMERMSEEAKLELGFE